MALNRPGGPADANTSHLSLCFKLTKLSADRVFTMRRLLAVITMQNRFQILQVAPILLLELNRTLQQEDCVRT